MSHVLALAVSLFVAAHPSAPSTSVVADPVAAVGPVVPSRLDVGTPAPPPIAVGDVTDVQQAPFRYSEAYYKRLAIHRTASYAILPLFAFQFAAGLQLYDKGQGAPAWAREGHPIGAVAIASLFAVNGVTGVMNLWEGRKDPDRPVRTVVHGIMMLTAGAGFTATGFLADDAKNTLNGKRTHRTVAISSMLVATAGYLSMTDLFRRE